MRFLNILNSEMLAKRLERDTRRMSLGAKAGMMHVQVELHGGDMPEEKAQNLKETAELIDAMVDDARDVEACLVALYDSATLHGSEIKILRQENAALKAQVQSLRSQLDLVSEK